MNTKFRQFKTVALLSMACDMLKFDVNVRCNVIILEDFNDILHVLGYVRRKSTLSTALGL